MTSSPTQPKLLDQVSARIRVKHYSIRTEQAYVDWIKRFIVHFDKRNPRDFGAVEDEAFLTHLAVAGQVAASTQNQAKSAILFPYREVLAQELPWLDNVERPKQPQRLPVVLTQVEVRALLSRLTNTQWLIASLLYGTGMRVLEVARLRVKDVEFSRKEIWVRDGKGYKDRVTMLPLAQVNPLREHLKRVKALQDNELAAGFGAVYLPLALERKYRNGAKEWMWQYVFPANRRSVDPRSGEERRPHVQDQAILRAIKQA